MQHSQRRDKGLFFYADIAGAGFNSLMQKLEDNYSCLSATYQLMGLPEEADVFTDVASTLESLREQINKVSELRYSQPEPEIVLDIVEHEPHHSLR